MLRKTLNYSCQMCAHIDTETEAQRRTHACTRMYNVANIAEVLASPYRLSKCRDRDMVYIAQVHWVAASLHMLRAALEVLQAGKAAELLSQPTGFDSCMLHTTCQL